MGLGIAASESPFAGEWRALLAHDRDDPPPQQAILALGSSSFRKWSSLKADLSPLQIINRGFGGARLCDLIASVAILVTPCHPRIVLIYGGDNDLDTQQASTDLAVQGMKDLLATLRAQLPHARLLVLAIKPSPLRAAAWPHVQEANRRISQLCAADALDRYIDTATPLLDSSGTADASCYLADRLHLDAAGYARWTAVIKPILLEQWRSAAAGQ